MKKPLYNLFPGKIFRSSQTNRSGAVTDSKAESNSIRTGERDKDVDTWVFVAAGVAGSSGSREDVGQGFWRERSAERETLATFVEGEGEETKSRAG